MGKFGTIATTVKIQPHLTSHECDVRNNVVTCALMCDAGNIANFKSNASHVSSRKGAIIGLGVPRC